MTSFAFIAGLLPLVYATGPGAIGNRTIGTTAAGGMLMGTVIGVLVIPGLYYLFGVISAKRKLIKDEPDETDNQIFEHTSDDGSRPDFAIVGTPITINEIPNGLPLSETIESS
jgi:HAE1 family hydrophobic/amphiphilic exporter-1